MKTCILTIIKNEHQYLDEWIQYHLRLGIDHIFIFEDLDSISHKEITNKYPLVSLNSISELLTSQEQLYALQIKHTPGKNIQPFYIKKGLEYIKNYQVHYDWCFVIDIDEFVTLENSEDRLNELLNQYKDYEAVILSWKCYGANNYVNKPNYNIKRVVDTYTETLKGYVPVINFTALTKTCYNLNQYHIDDKCNVHQPDLSHNCCRTDLTTDRTRSIYKYIYLRHYITKSWEEFYQKRKNRGFFFGGSRRDLDAFFKMNPDMYHLRSQLIPEPDNDASVLVILPFIQRRMQGEEIYLALNSWKKFCTFKYKFIVVGTFDNNLRKAFPWVMFIPVESTFNQVGQYNPHLDIQNKINTIRVMFEDFYPGFIYMTDDIYAIKPFTLSDILTVHYHSNSFTGKESAPTNYWQHDKWKTRQLLDKEGKPHINYTTHFPFYFNFKKLNDLWEKYNMLKESYVFEDVYFNMIEHETPVLDNTIRLGIWNKDIYQRDFEGALANPNIKFVCNSVEGWSRELEESLKKVVGMTDENSSNSWNG